MTIRNRGSIDVRLLGVAALRVIGLVALAAMLGAAVTYLAG